MEAFLNLLYRRLNFDQQEVSGLKWFPDRQHLASGGNDNKLARWILYTERPIRVYGQRQTAVKAIA
jgi:WD40 repeat protein